MKTIERTLLLSAAILALLASHDTSAAGFQLETTTNLLAPGSWSPVATVNNSCAASHTNRASLFRLVQQ